MATEMELTSPCATQTAIAHVKRFDLGVILIYLALLRSGEAGNGCQSQELILIGENLGNRLYLTPV